MVAAFTAPSALPPANQTPIASVSYPDSVRRPRLPITHQRAWFGPERDAVLPSGAFDVTLRSPGVAIFDVTLSTDQPVPLDWLGRYPDSVRRPSILTAAQRSWSAPDFTPVSATPDLSAQTYPDKVVRPSLSTSQQLAWTGSLRQPDPPPLSWGPSFPDRVLRPSVLVADQDAYFSADQPPDSLGWLPGYVDRVLAAKTLPAAQQRAFSSPERQPDPPPLSWGPSFPDQVRGPKSVASQPSWTGPEIVQVPAPDLSKPSYPDRVLGIRSPITALQDAWVGPDRLPDINVPDLVVVTYPDRLPLRTRPWYQSYAGPERQPDPTPLSWHPTYADKVDPPRSLRPAAQQDFAAPARQPDPPALSWLSSYPDRYAHAVGVRAGSTWEGPTREPEPPTLAWRPTFPDSTRRAKLHPALPPYFQLWPFPLPPAPAPALSWHPTYPDSVRRGTFHASRQLAFSRPPEIVIVIFFGPALRGEISELGRLAALVSSDPPSGSVSELDPVRGTIEPEDDP